MKRFITTQSLGNDIKLTGPEHHHLAFVVRSKVGDNVILTNGDTNDYKYNIVKITRDETILAFDSKSKNKQNPKKSLVVFNGLIKPDNLAWIVEKLNELGVSEFVPFICANSNIKSSNFEKLQEKLQEIARQSCKQCGRSIPMKVHHPIKFAEMIHEMPNFENAFYADRGEKRAKVTKAHIEDSSYNALIIGPEGGFTMDENLAITEVAMPFTLGARTLRSETAAVTASAILLHKMGEI